MSGRDLIARAYRRIRNGRLRFESVGTSWQDAEERSSGYGTDVILERVTAAARTVRDGGAAFERDGVLFAQCDFVWPVIGAVLSRARGGSLHVLDFGGSLGSTYFQHLPLIKRLDELRWSVVEQPNFVAVGRSEFADGVLDFHESIEAACAQRTPDVALFSSVLQYLPDPRAVLDEVRAAGIPALVVDRTPFTDLPGDRACIQRVPKRIYSGAYPMWAFSRTSFDSYLERHWRRVATFVSPEGRAYRAGRIRLCFEGFLAEAR